MNLVLELLVLFIGVAYGIAVGIGFVAFITVLDILPRLTQLTKSMEHLRSYEFAVILGVICFTLLDFRGWTLHISSYWAIPLGLFMGLFIGLLAAAITEVVNVIPILAKRLNLQSVLATLLMAMVLGKIIGSLLQWLVFHVG